MLKGATEKVEISLTREAATTVASGHALLMELGGGKGRAAIKLLSTLSIALHWASS